jgi:hypothetical protein
MATFEKFVESKFGKNLLIYSSPTYAVSNTDFPRLSRVRGFK